MRTILAIIALSLVVGCVGLRQAPAAPARSSTDTDRVGCGAPGCWLHVPAGVELVETGERLSLVHQETGVTMEVRTIRARPAPADQVPGAVARLLDAWAHRLAPAARFSQPPQSLDPSRPDTGIVVRGISGTRRPQSDAIIDPDPVRVHLLTFASTATGRVLVLRTRGPQAAWPQAWPVLSTVAQQVELAGEF